MSLEKKKLIEFDWDEEFERKIVMLLIDYRLSEKTPGCVMTVAAFEREHARRFLQAIRSLMESRAPELVVDSDIAAAFGRLKLVNDSAKSREQERLGDDFDRIWHGRAE